jgi:hypothetical protein
MFFNLKPIILLEEGLWGLHSQLFLFPFPTLLFIVLAFFFFLKKGVPIVDHMEIMVIFSNTRLAFIFGKRQGAKGKKRNNKE